MLEKLFILLNGFFYWENPKEKFYPSLFLNVNFKVIKKFSTGNKFLTYVSGSGAAAVRQRYQVS
jgi:hypothetical protein